ncbi:MULTISPECIES: hypothetical protein [Phyllobacterium]|uniref:hypothetical protein n=1 Tax=Phyllobacterium TaxID=28100 RepID=UPI001CBEBCCF|nr:hypothetical protein [Phyllobacterium calauticae]MBZ3695469.1 hypothetical protein [Phyllobacterium calauticae]
MNNVIRFERKRGIEEILSELKGRLDRIEVRNHALHEQVECIETSVRSPDALLRVERGNVGLRFKDARILGTYRGKRWAYACNVTGNKHDALQFAPLRVGDLILEDWPFSEEARLIESCWNQITKHNETMLPQHRNSSWCHNDQQIDNYGPVAFASISCDAYEAICVLFNYLTIRLTIGSIVHIEKWSTNPAQPNPAVEVGFKEWLGRNPRFKLRLREECDRRLSFIVVAC